MTDDITIEGFSIRTPRLLLRPWRVNDAAEALEIYGNHEVSRWLAPAMQPIEDLEAMRALIAHWITTPAGPEARPTGRWALEEIETRRLVGSGQILPLPPSGDDLELGYQLAPWAWGRGLAAEAGHALAHYAFERGEDEIFAVVRHNNTHGAQAARRIGMEWVGETDKYYNLRLQVFRLRPADIDTSPLEPAPVER